jgi:hypothetical protein
MPGVQRHTNPTWTCSDGTTWPSRKGAVFHERKLILKSILEKRTPLDPDEIEHVAQALLQDRRIHIFHNTPLNP